MNAFAAKLFPRELVNNSNEFCIKTNLRFRIRFFILCIYSIPLYISCDYEQWSTFNHFFRLCAFCLHLALSP